MTLGNPPPNSPRLGGRRACHPHSAESHILLSDPSSNLQKNTWVRKECPCPVSAPNQVGRYYHPKHQRVMIFHDFTICVCDNSVTSIYGWSMNKVEFSHVFPSKNLNGSDTEPGTRNQWISYKKHCFISRRASVANLFRKKSVPPCSVKRNSSQSFRGCPPKPSKKCLSQQSLLPNSAGEHGG